MGSNVTYRKLVVKLSESIAEITRAIVSISV